MNNKSQDIMDRLDNDDIGNDIDGVADNSSDTTIDYNDSNDTIDDDVQVTADNAIDEAAKSSPQVVGALDDMDDISNPEPTYEERIARAMANNPPTPCKRDKAKDDKLSKIFTYSAVPFFLTSIGLSMFNMGRVRYPLSFLFLAIAVGILATGYILRVANNHKCNCSVCETQSKSFKMSFAIWGLVSVGAMIAFFVMIFK